MLLPSQKPAKALFLVFAFKIYLRHQSVMQFLSGAPPPKKNPPLHLLPADSSMTLNTSLNKLILWFRLWLDTPAVFECLP